VNYSVIKAYFIFKYAVVTQKSMQERHCIAHARISGVVLNSSGFHYYQSVECPHFLDFDLQIKVIGGKETTRNTKT
jgi:hypothetical protein